MLFPRLSFSMVLLLVCHNQGEVDTVDYGFDEAFSLFDG